jgi:ATP-dependent 26S proteasome regulatory subunit
VNKEELKAAKLSNKAKEVPETLAEKLLSTEGTKDLEAALSSIRTFLRTQETFIYMIDHLRSLLPEIGEKQEDLDKSNLISEFTTGDIYGYTDDSIQGIGPVGIGLVAIDDFLKSPRFTLTDPLTLPSASRLSKPYETPLAPKTPVSIGETDFLVPMESELFVEDSSTGKKFVIHYQAKQNSVQVKITADAEDRSAMLQLAMEMKKVVITNKYIKGKIIEIAEGSVFDVKELHDQPFPILNKELQDELEKNVINIFKKRDEFLKYGIPAKRSVILEGPPGCGKTLIERYLASRVAGEVTTIWVTSKSIKRSSDVAYIFEIARKMAPSLIVMEDLDLISGTRAMQYGGDNVLGEMLNQMDGLTQDNSIVMIGSTNRVSSLDEALADRPGRFDRIFKVGKPEGDVASKIARSYLLKHGIEEEIVNSLDLEDFFADGDLTGAQIVEVCKGAIFEAIHRNGIVTGMHLSNSKRGLLSQRQLLGN